MNTQKVIETRYYNTDGTTSAIINEGIMTVNFYEIGMKVTTKAYSIHETDYQFCKKWYPHVMEDLKADPLPTKFRVHSQNFEKPDRLIRVR